MKIPVYGLGLILAALVAVADPASPAPKPELRGVMDLGNGKRFLLALTNGPSGNWEKVGDTFGDWTLAEFREKDQTLVLQGSNGAKFELHLAASPADTTDTSNEVYAVNYLQTRVLQLREEYQAAKKDLADFEAKHDGQDPSRLRDPQDAIVGNALVNRAAVTRQRYEALYQRLKDAEGAAALGPGSP